jgi:hypothetical protein
MRKHTVRSDGSWSYKKDMGITSARKFSLLLHMGIGVFKTLTRQSSSDAIIYTSKHCPQECSYKAEDGTIVWEELSKDPIKVRGEQEGPEGELEPESRLNYSKIYTVENYVRVLNIGMVDTNSLPSLRRNSMIYRETPVEKPARYPARADSSHHRGSKRKDKEKGKR